MTPRGTRLAESQRVAMVAGGRAGIGRAIALGLAREGYEVYAGFRGSRGGYEAGRAQLEDAAGPLARRVHAVRLDVTNEASVTAAVGWVLNRAERVDVLVNAAGFGTHGPWESISVQQMRNQLETNLLGCFRMCKAVVPQMRHRRHGYVINVSSQAGLRASFGDGAYSASKYALEGLSLAMRLELRQFGVRVAMINPGWCAATEYADAMVDTDDWRTETGAYGPLITQFKANQRRTDTPVADLHQVVEVVLRLVGLDDPPFNNPIGCIPPRLPHQDLDAYERLIFRHYKLTEFERLPRSPTRGQPAHTETDPMLER